jgi:hypothetical protein
MPRIPTLLTALTLPALALAQPVAAKTFSFRATLGGTRPPTITGSPASGSARIRVDTAANRVSIDLDVTGITLDQLNAVLAAQPNGPVGFYQYHTADDVEPILPLPYGAAYRATPGGFRLTLRDFDYAKGTKLSGSSVSIDDFVTAMRAGKIVLTVHSDKFTDGAISGATVGG